MKVTLLEGKKRHLLGKTFVLPIFTHSDTALCLLFGETDFLRGNVKKKENRFGMRVSL